MSDPTNTAQQGQSRRRVVLAGSEKKLPANTRISGRANDEERLEVTLSIYPRQPLSTLDTEALTSVGTLPSLSMAEYAAMYGADPQDLARVVAFAAEYGLTVVSSDALRRSVVLAGTVAAFNVAFGVTLYTGEHLGGTYRLRTEVIHIPEDMQGIVSGVFGLDNRPFAAPHVHVPDPTETVPDGFTPPEIARLYNFPADVTGVGQTIGLIELAGGYHLEDIKTYFDDLAIPLPKLVDFTFSGGGANTPGSDDAADLEVTLDIEVVGTVAPGAQLVVYFASELSDSAFLNVLKAAVFDQLNHPSILSISWGASEDKATAQFMDEFNRVLLAAAHLHITVCVSVGDSGLADYSADDPTWDGQAHIDFPASDPHTLACGGTFLTVRTDGSGIADEVVFSTGKNRGTGGGISQHFPLPKYQQKANVPPARNPSGPIMRGIPDVAGNADSRSGYIILCNGQRYPDQAKKLPPIGGTSAVTPLWAGLVALFNQSLGVNVGFINPLLYRLPASAFHDIQKGSNGDYSASFGWDACTGLGTPDGQALLNALKAIL